jgi:hypothetical protein
MRLLLALVIVSATAIGALADEKVERRRAALLEQMRSLAEKTEVTYKEAKGKPELVKSPVFRYDDQPRRFIDATMWVWTDGGRPVAFEKVEAKYHVESSKPEWGYCFTSVTPELVAVTWSPERGYRSTEPGIAFAPVAKAPAVAERSTERKRQARELSREFSATIILDPRNNTTQEMRLLTTPIFEYADPETKELRGSVFGFATNGTNPDLLLLLEVQGKKEAPEWHFAAARMTSGGIKLRRKEAQVWETTWVNWTEAPFATWTFFQTPRKPVPHELP